MAGRDRRSASQRRGAACVHVSALRGRLPVARGSGVCVVPLVPALLRRPGRAAELVISDEQPDRTAEPASCGHRASMSRRDEPASMPAFSCRSRALSLSFGPRATVAVRRLPPAFLVPRLYARSSATVAVPAAASAGLGVASGRVIPNSATRRRLRDALSPFPSVAGRRSCSGS